MKYVLIPTLILSLLFEPAVIAAFETDQYNLPLTPLADIGEEVTDYTQRNIGEAVEKVNRKILSLKSCLDGADREAIRCRNTLKPRADLKYLRSDEAIARAVYNEMGKGFIPFTKSSSWMEGHKFKKKNARFKTDFSRSIYITAPINYLTLSSTVRLYGTEFGTDKIAHIFQQGYDYHKIYKRALKKGLTEADAIGKAVKWGRKTEDTYFGTWVSGVYSNADLYSNYAGLKFYIGLTREIKIGDSVRPPTLVLEEGVWVFNRSPEIHDSLLRPFISNHLNEAFNPNKYFNVLRFRKVIRSVVKKHSCQQWKERFPDLTKTKLDSITKSLELWNGEDYGFSGSRHFITIANTCFEGN